MLPLADKTPARTEYCKISKLTGTHFGRLLLSQAQTVPAVTNLICATAVDTPLTTLGVELTKIITLLNCGDVLPRKTPQLQSPRRRIYL